MRSQFTLFLLLPFLLSAILCYSRVTIWNPGLVSVSSDGKTVVYYLDGIEAIRRSGGRSLVWQNINGSTETDVPNSGLRYFCTDKVCVSHNRGWLQVYDANDLSLMGDPIELPVQLNQNTYVKFAFSRNKKYLAVHRLDPTLATIDIVDLDDLKVVWSESNESDGRIETQRYEPTSNHLLGGLFENAPRYQFEKGKPVRVPDDQLDFFADQSSARQHLNVYTNWTSELFIDPVRENRKKPLSYKVQLPIPNGLVYRDLQDERAFVLKTDTATAAGSWGWVDHSKTALSIVNLAKARIERTQYFAGGTKGFALSNDGKTFARVVQPSRTLWQRTSPLLADNFTIETYDVATGARIRIFREHRSFLLPFLLSLIGTIVWTIAWLRTSWKQANTYEAFSSILVVGLLWLAYFFLRMFLASSYILHPQRLPSLGSITLLATLTMLIPFWIVFAKISIVRRIGFGMFGFALVWMPPTALYQLYGAGLDRDQIPADCLFLGHAAGLLAIVLRICQLKLVHQSDSNSPLRKTAWGISQLELVDLFLLMSGIALVIGLSQALHVHNIQSFKGYYREFVVAELILCLPLLGVAVSSSWSGMLSVAWPYRVGIAAVSGLACALCFFFIKVLPPWDSQLLYMAMTVTIGCTMFAAVSLIRRCGWRIVWRGVSDKAAASISD